MERLNAFWHHVEHPVTAAEPLRHTLGELVDFDSLCKWPTRLTVGAVNACNGAMSHFDTMKMVECAPWRAPTDPIEGVVEHL